MPSGRKTRVILPQVRDPRLITVRRGGTLTNRDHALLALWAADCAEHVLHLFEAVRPDDPRPRDAIEHDLGAAAYALKAARAAVSEADAERARNDECHWQQSILDLQIRDLVLDDQRRRNDICWSVFVDHRP